MLGKFSVPGRPTCTNLDNSRARAYRACSRCGWWLFGRLFSLVRLWFLFSFSFSERRPDIVGWLVGCFGYSDLLRQYFGLYQAVSQREGERGEEG